MNPSVITPASAVEASIPAPGKLQPLAVLELLKPVTWFPPMWAFMCGVVSSGVALSGNWHLAIGGVILAGPLVCAMSQAINDWYDRHVDAINEPDRPIPSGRVPGRWGLYIALIWTVLSLVMAWFLGPAVLAATVVGLVLAAAYSAPPFRLKNNGWWGNAACGICYEGLAWFTGAAVMTGGWPDWRIVTLAILYSAGAHGIMTLNDFKSIEGDREMNVRTIPVQIGAANAARVASVVMTLPQLAVIGLLYSWDKPVHAGIIVVAVLLQLVVFSYYLLRADSLAANPRRNAAFTNLYGVTLYVAGMLVSALAISSILSAGL
ncbi:chlorophyll synthase ChlG [Ahrensia sp. R2A130]|uniref:chlorophyll synthase ChlG n=1 Tax=Ahrensia sp. R2A130 TaxID=744979 RepID=UPI0001E08C75|nr:chlorophyll synthase ChlG [Ahrensia sp. R2A130]EFL89098.1 bacteriochlorophyll synthase 33 kDa chain [Ahrensia sp. R2A130]